VVFLAELIMITFKKLIGMTIKITKPWLSKIAVHITAGILLDLIIKVVHGASCDNGVSGLK
jgi:hypothetical protein